MMNNEKDQRITRRSRLVLVPCPFQGHINPTLQLGTVLHSQGFSISVAHSKFNSPDPSTHPDFDFRSIIHEELPQDSCGGDLVALIMLINDNCRAPFRELLSELLVELQKKDDDDEMINCVVYDELMYFVETVAHQLRLPSMILRTTSATSFIFRNFYPWYEGEGKIVIQGLRSHDIVPRFYPLRLKDLPFTKRSSLKNVLQVIENTSNTKTSSAIIFNTTDFLEGPWINKIQQSCLLPVFSIGPLNKLAPGSSSSSLIKEDYTCITWLDRQTQGSVLYISLGSITTITQSELVEMAWGLANSKQPFLWVVRPGSVIGLDWIESLPVVFKESIGERGCIVKWAPQRKVLAHDSVGGFLSHCGWNSTLESISEGVPIICRPESWDQKVNARYVSFVWGVGLDFEKDVLERGEVERVVRRLMGDKDGLEIRERAKDLKEKVKVCVREGGFSRNSLNELVKLIRSF